MSTKTLMTVEQLEQLPEDGNTYELDEGELVAKSRHAVKHDRVKMRVVERLIDHKRLRGGEVYCETGFILTQDPETFRKPDVSFFPKESVAKLGRADVLESPDLCIEVVSSETATELDRKIRQYFDTGARAVLVLYPEPETVHVFTGPKSTRILAGDDVLNLPDLLPGFSLPVRTFFRDG